MTAISPAVIPGQQSIRKAFFVRGELSAVFLTQISVYKWEMLVYF